ncbi:hypothetical protein [Agromyces sp. NPDC058110]|uniref:hypothetical protein n=1 Tax=Agromyces sp. NPDC058110 TaxID=3346345 RepID=UPI0036DA093F
MSDTLTISGAGSTAVAVDSLLADVDRLVRAEARVSGWISRFDDLHARSLALCAEASSSGPLPWPEVDLRAVGVRLEEAACRISGVRQGLEQSAERYGSTERFVSALWDLGGELGARALGFVAPQALAGSVLAMLPLVLPTLVGLAVARAFGALPESGVADGAAHAVVRWLEQHRDVLGDPAFVRLVRTFADHADDALLAASHVPALAGVGSLVDAPESASLLLGAAGVLGLVTTGRALVDRPVRVERLDAEHRGAERLGAQHSGADRPGAGERAAVPERDTTVAPPSASAATPPPDGFEDLAARVPRSDGEAQITVERYSVDGEQRWMVYIGGTVEFGGVAGPEPFDMTSNIHGIADDAPIDAARVAGADSGAAERAVRDALVAAGAEPGDPILAVGHSGGGVIAAALAADPELNVVGGVNLGGPIATAQIPDGRPFVSVEHEDDLVPATGGSGHASGVQVVARRAIDPGAGGDAGLPAHQLVEYRRTTAIMDDSDDPGLVAFRAGIAEFTGGTVGERSRWRAERDPAG